MRITGLPLLVSEKHISNGATEDATRMSAANPRGNNWEWAHHSQLYAFGTYTKFNEQ